MRDADAIAALQAENAELKAELNRAMCHIDDLDRECDQRHARAEQAEAERDTLERAAQAVLRDKLDEIEAQIGRECRDHDIPIRYRKLMWALARLDQRKEVAHD